MKVQLASDLHLEFLDKDWPGERIIEPHPEADVLVLAGDIANGDQAMRLFQDWPVPIIYVAGNHEFYRHPLAAERLKMRKACPGNMHFLENETAVIGDTRFLGATLWTDYLLNTEFTQYSAMIFAQMNLNDHSLIRNGRHLFSPKHALALHVESRKWLTDELAKPWLGKTVVVTHHAPHPGSTHPRFADSALNPAFVSDLSEILLSDAAPSLWLHGHVHDGFDYTVGNCRVVANPAGYIMNRRQATDREQFTFENPAFSSSMLLAV